MEVADAVLFAWYPGEQGGRALADILFGDRNPSGRLPITFYNSVQDLPPFDNYSMEGRTYKFFKGEPLFPFGYGLSYTTFKYKGATVSKDIYSPGEPVVIELTIENTGDRAGEEVVMVYASKAGETMEMNGHYRPSSDEKAMVAFKRVPLQAGETKTIPISVDLMNMFQWDEEGGRYFVDKGTYILQTSPCEGNGFTLQILIE
jgi:beta-glucosidase